MWLLAAVQYGYNISVFSVSIDTANEMWTGMGTENFKQNS